MSRREAYQAHRKKWEGCVKCRIGGWAFTKVLGVGNLHAPFVLVGEGPGVSEDALGIPFIGAAGKLLHKGMGLARFSPEDWFMTNLVACRPRDTKRSGNRAPNKEEVRNCTARLDELMLILSPKHIIAVGNVPQARLLEQVGKYAYFNPTYWKIRHPAWVLRQGGESSDAWVEFVEDLKKIKRRAQCSTTHIDTV